MTPLRAIDSPTDTATNRHDADAFEQLADAGKAPKSVTDDTGRTLTKLEEANKLAGPKPGGLPEGKRICDVVQRGEGERAVFDLLFENDARISATAKQLYDPRHMDPALTVATNLPPDWWTSKEWRPFAIAVIGAAEPDNATDSEASETLEWLASFIDHTCTQQLIAHAPNTAVQLDDAASLFTVLSSDDGAFWASDRRLYVRPPQFVHHVNTLLNERTNSTDARRRLGRLGFTKPKNSQGQLAARHGGHTITRRYLASEPGFKVS